MCVHKTSERDAKHICYFLHGEVKEKKCNGYLKKIKKDQYNAWASVHFM